MILTRPFTMILSMPACKQGLIHNVKAVAILFIFGSHVTRLIALSNAVIKLRIILKPLHLS